jgi:integrase
MAIDLNKAKPSPRHAGVYLLPDGRLLARAGVRMADGKVKVVKRLLPVGATEIDAVNLVATIKAEALNPPTPPEATRMHRPLTSSQTFELYCAQWLAVRELRISPATKQTYTATIHHFIGPRLGHLACNEVTRHALESWVAWAERQKQKSGKQYTQDTMRQWWRVLQCVVADMTADFDLPDPTRRVRPPERPELMAVREQGTLDAKAVGRLLEICEVDYPQWYPEVATMTLTGARAGEVYALKWDAIDFDKGTITIKRAVSRGILLERTKTKQQRIVPLSKDLDPILRAHKQQQEDDKVVGLDTGLVFLSKDGTVRDPNDSQKLWLVLAEKAEIGQRIGPQVMRRSLNTLMVAKGVDRITLRAIMGHTSEQMTQRYAGIGEAAKADAIELVRPARVVAAEATEPELTELENTLCQAAPAPANEPSPLRVSKCCPPMLSPGGSETCNYGAGNGTRTRNIQLGKLTLYH